MGTQLIGHASVLVTLSVDTVFSVTLKVMLGTRLGITEIQDHSSSV
jgi:hypothetical protein